MIALLSGCGMQNRPEGMPRLYPATLTATQEGVPLANASIMLYPQDPAMTPWGTGGYTDDHGNLVVFTYGKYRGVVPGKYKVCVSKLDFDPSTFVGEPTDATMAAYDRAEMMRQGYDLVDPKLGKQETTTLEVEFQKGKNSLTLEVGKAVRIPIKK